MSRLFARIHKDKVPKFNPLVVNGVAVAQMEDALKYIDNAFKMSAENFPPELEYIGYRLCTVMEEFKMISARKNQTYTLELAPSDVYAVNYYFSYKGEELPPKTLFVPFVNRSGRIHIRGKNFTVVPVLADETLSVSKEDIYVPFLSAKVTFKRKQHLFMVDGIQRTEYLVYSKIHNQDLSKQVRRNVRANQTVNCVSCIPHYLFCKYGIKGTFRHFYHLDDIHFFEDEEINKLRFPDEHYAICSSRQIRPSSVKLKYYTPTRIQVVIPRKHLTNPGIMGLICGFFYVADNYPDRLHASFLDDTEDEIRLWRILLGKVIYRNNDSDGVFVEKIREHFDSLDQYLDDGTKEGLAAQGYNVNDFYDLMALLVHEYTNILMHTDPASMYGKMLAVNRYVLADIIKAISYFKFKIINVKNRELTAGDINKHLGTYLKPEVFFNGLRDHNEILSLQGAGDNIIFNYTSKMILQEKATNGRRKKKNEISFKDSSKLLHTSIALAGSILALPKSEPTGRTVINPYLPLDRSWKIKKPDNLREKLDYLQTQIVRE